MPLLTKRNFVKEKSTSSSQPKKNDQKKFKTPLLTKENIEKLLMKDDKLTQKINDSISASQSPIEIRKGEQPKSASGILHNKKKHSKKALIRTKSDVSVISMHVSFENVSQKDTESVSDISYRMNEPKIKEAYFQFVRKLSQSSNEKCATTSTPLDTKKSKGDNTEGTSLQKVHDCVSKNAEKREKAKIQRQSKKLKKTSSGKCKSKLSKEQEKPSNIACSMKNIMSENSYESQILSQDSGLSLSQEVLNQKEVKAAYVKFMKSSLGSDHDIIQSKNKAWKRKFILSSSSEESLDTLSQVKKGKKKNKSVVKGSESSVKEVDLFVKGTPGINNKKPKSKQRGERNTRNTSEGALDKSLINKTNRKSSENRKVSYDEEDSSNKNLTIEERLALIQESRNVGLYVLCDICDKARYLPHVKDPLELPGKWYCPMNPDTKHNKCSDLEEVKEDAEYLIDNLYNAGSIVWSKMYGYPWWPAMVDDDPDIETYFWLEGNSMTPTWYHITFFDSGKVTRAWMRPSNLKPFKINMNDPYFHASENKYMLRVQTAFKQACAAIELPLIERLRKYSFMARFNHHKRERGVRCKNLKKEGKGRNNNKNEDIYSGRPMDLNVSLVSKNPSMSRPNVDNFAANKNDEIHDDLSVILNDISLLDSRSLSFDLFDKSI